MRTEKQTFVIGRFLLKCNFRLSPFFKHSSVELASDVKTT